MVAGGGVEPPGCVVYRRMSATWGPEELVHAIQGYRIDLQPIRRFRQ